MWINKNQVSKQASLVLVSERMSEWMRACVRTYVRTWVYICNYYKFDLNDWHFPYSIFILSYANILPFIQLTNSHSCHLNVCRQPNFSSIKILFVCFVMFWWLFFFFVHFSWYRFSYSQCIIAAQQFIQLKWHLKYEIIYDLPKALQTEESARLFSFFLGNNKTADKIKPFNWVVANWVANIIQTHSSNLLCFCVTKIYFGLFVTANGSSDC